MILISYILVALAAICNAYMDIWMIRYMILNENMENQLNPNWWSFNPKAKWFNGEYSGKKANNILLAKIGIKTTWLSTNCNDAWHFFKSLMIVLLCTAIILFVSYNHTFISKTIELIILGAIWNLTFNLIYNNKNYKQWH